MVAPQRLSPSWPSLVAQDGTPHQISPNVHSVHLLGGGGMDTGSHPLTLRTGTYLGKISCLPRSHKEAGHWPGTAPRPGEGTDDAG